MRDFLNEAAISDSISQLGAIICAKAAEASDNSIIVHKFWQKNRDALLSVLLSML